MKITDRIMGKLKEVKSCIYNYEKMQLSITYQLNESSTLSELHMKVSKIITDIQLQNSIKTFKYTIQDDTIR